ncbi:hypothetical protein ACWGOK_01850 [Streptomyces eurythermus]
MGGPLGGANPRTGGHLAAHLPGVTLHPYDSTNPDSVAIEVGGAKYLFDRGNEEYVLVAKFTPAESSKPVFVVCGQSSTAHLAAIHFMRREFAQGAKQLSSIDRFCVLIKVSDIGTYQHHRTALEQDVSAAAFAR